MYTCVCGKKVLHYLHYLHLFSPASVPSRTYIGIDSRLRSYRPTPIYVWGDVDIRVKRCPYTYATLIRSRLAMAIPPPLSYASLGNQTGKNRGRSIACNPYRLFARCACRHTSGANGLQVLALTDPLHTPIRAIVPQNIHRHDSFFLGVFQDIHQA